MNISLKKNVTDLVMPKSLHSEKKPLIGPMPIKRVRQHEASTNGSVTNLKSGTGATLTSALVHRPSSHLNFKTRNRLPDESHAEITLVPALKHVPEGYIHKSAKLNPKSKINQAVSKAEKDQNEVKSTKTLQFLPFVGSVLRTPQDNREKLGLRGEKSDYNVAMPNYSTSDQQKRKLDSRNEDDLGLANMAQLAYMNWEGMTPLEALRQNHLKVKITLTSIGLL